MSELRQWEGWQLGESSAEAYERYLVPRLFAPGAEYLIELAAPRPGERVLDVACGTGKSFMPFLARGWDVTACDLSPAMLARAATVAGR